MKLTWYSAITTALFGLNVLLLTLFAFKLNLFSPATPLQDFDAYMRLVEVIRHGGNPYQVSFMQTLGPPLSFLYYYPFSFLPLGMARMVTMLIQIVSLYLTCWIVLKGLKIPNRFPVFLFSSLLFLSSFPVRFSLLMGQPNGVLALCVALLVSTQSVRMQTTAVSVLFLIKSIYILPLLVLLRTRPKQWIISMGIILSAIGVSCLLFSSDLYQEYVTQTFLPVVSATTSPIGTDYYNQSLRSTVFRSGLLALYPFVFPTLFLLCVILVLMTQSMSLAILSSLLLSPVSWQHYFVILFPIAVLLFHRKKDWWKFTVFLCLWWKDVPSFHLIALTPLLGVFVSHFFLSCIWLFLWIVKGYTSEYVHSRHLK